MNNKVYKYSDIIEYSENSVISKKIHQSKAGNITLFSFDKGQQLSPHSAPYNAFVSIIEGSARITIGDDEYHLEAGENIMMPANIEHGVYADDKFKMLLTMIKDKSE